MKFSHHLASVKGSATAKVFSEAKKLEASGKKVYHLEIGQPDFLPIDEILQSTSKFVLEGKVQYTVSRGIPELRQEISKYYSALYGNPANYENEIIVSAGAKISIFAALWSVINSGDNVIVLNPAWVSYDDMIRSLGGTVKYLPVDLAFNFDESKLRKLINLNTKAIIVNSPSNPTGAILERKGLELLYQIATENDLLLISDEIYNEYVYSGKFYSLANIKNWKDNGLIINGMSKTFSMTGYRIGYAMSNEKIISSINKVMQLTASCPVNFGQRASVVALQNIDKMRERINNIMPRRRDLASKLLSEMDVEYKPPSGAIYGFFKIPGVDSFEFSNKVLKEKGVATTPGRAFGPAGEEHIRISLATPDEELSAGILKIGELLKN